MMTSANSWPPPAYPSAWGMSVVEHMANARRALETAVAKLKAEGLLNYPRS